MRHMTSSVKFVRCDSLRFRYPPSGQKDPIYCKILLCEKRTGSGCPSGLAALWPCCSYCDSNKTSFYGPQDTHGSAKLPVSYTRKTNLLTNGLKAWHVADKNDINSLSIKFGCQ